MLLRSNITRRRGNASLAVLIMLPALLLAVALGLFSAQLVETKTNMQKSVDAAALAGVQELADDAMLIGLEGPAREVLARSEAEARRYALENPVAGQPLELRRNPANHPDGDFVVGYLDWPRDAGFAPADTEHAHRSDLHLVNAVRVTGHRTLERGNPVYLLGGPFLSHVPTDSKGRATAMLDHRVVGFRPVHDSPIPLVPIALLSDPSGENKKSWEYQVQRKKGKDQWRYSREQRRCLHEPGGDGLHEMEVKFGGEHKMACLLQLGSDGVANLAVQVVEGVNREGLSLFDGELILDEDNKKVVPGTWHCPGSGSAGHHQLALALEQLRLSGEARAWPLFRGTDRNGMPILSGFVAARVALVWQDDNDGSLCVSLSPAALCTGSAVTAFCVGRGPEAPSSPYVSKVRLVE